MHPPLWDAFNGGKALNKFIPFVFFLVIFTGAWIVFSVFDIGWGNQTIKVYSASNTDNQQLFNNTLYPELFPNKIIQYRVFEKHVIGNISGIVEIYDNCKIFDAENWSCTYFDDSATFGFRYSEYFLYRNTVKFPHLERYDEENFLSRFGYIVLGCRWDWTSGAIQMINCFFRPFTT